MPTLTAIQPQWVAVRVQNSIVDSALNWAPGPDAWRQAAKEAFYQLAHITKFSTDDNFQNREVPDQRNPRFAQAYPRRGH